MKVLLFSTNADLAGAPMHVFFLAQYLRNQGKSVCVVLGNNGPIFGMLSQVGLVPEILGSIKSQINIVGDLEAVFKLRSLLKSHKPHILHLHSSEAAAIGRLAALFLGIPVLYTVHGWSFGRSRPILQSVIGFSVELLLSRLTSSYIFVSTHDYMLAKRYGFARAANSFIVPNSIPDYACEHPQPQWDCFMAARVHPSKDYHTLFKAFKHIPFNLAVAGEGTDSLDFMTKALRHVDFARQKISFLGIRDDIPDLISRSRLVILASNYESLPIFLIEGLRAGKPLIASDVGDVGALVSSGINGYLVKTGDSYGLANAIYAVLSNESLYNSMCSESRERFVENYSIDNAGRMILDVYSSLFVG
jgi:glycosyltransferase involved in cell wall biosynthesis